MNEIELKDCPFPLCGGKGHLHEDWAGRWYIACNECGIQTMRFNSGRDIVIERWNARRESAEIAALRERNEDLETMLALAKDALKILGDSYNHAVGCSMRDMSVRQRALEAFDAMEAQDER